MNSIKAISTDYLRSDRSIETLLISKGSHEKMFWIYNFEGIHFRVFEQWSDVLAFFNDAFEPKHAFEHENDLDNFLLNAPLN